MTEPATKPATITIRYFGIFSQYTGCTMEEVELAPATTLGQLVIEICQRHGEAFKEALEADLDYRSAITAVNGELAPKSTVLRQGDEVVISYPAGGG